MSSLETWQDRAYFDPADPQLRGQYRRLLSDPQSFQYPGMAVACLATWEARQGKYQIAHDRLQEAIRRADGHLLAQADLGRRLAHVLTETGHALDGIEAAREAVWASQNDRDYGRSLVTLASYLSLEDFNAEASRCLTQSEPLIAQDPGRRWSYAWSNLRARDLASRGQFNAASSMLQAIHNVGGARTAAETLHTQANLWELAGRPKHSAPGVAEALFQAAAQYAQLNLMTSVQRAIADLEELASIDARAKLWLARAKRFLPTE